MRGSNGKGMASRSWATERSLTIRLHCRLRNNQFFKSHLSRQECMEQPGGRILSLYQHLLLNLNLRKRKMLKLMVNGALYFDMTEIYH